jgi:hypothetical protein
MADKPMLHLPGYDTEGPDTLGAAYAREHPEVLPDAVAEADAASELGKGFTCCVAGKHTLRFSVGQSVAWLGRCRATVMAVQPTGVVLDTRALTAEQLGKEVDPERLVLWRGVYWWVAGVRGVFVTLAYWGRGIKRKGARIYYRGGKPHARQA